MIYLGIDSGTQSTKTLALDAETGEILATAQQAYELLTGLPPGHMEQDPACWIEAAGETVRQCLAKLGSRKNEVAGIGVSGQQHGLVVLNGGGEPVRPAKLWCDTSTVDQCAELTRELGGAEEVIRLSGNAMLPGYTAPKILWLKQNEPANYASVRTILLPHDYLNYWLTGEKRMEYGDASGTALMDVKKREWSLPILEAIDPDLSSLLPPLQSSLSPVGILRETLRKEWGLPENVLVSAGGGDNMMGAIGTGNVKPGVMTASFGTSGTLYSCTAEPVIDAKGEVAAFCDSADHWLPLVCTMNVTVATSQICKLFGWGHEELEGAVRSEPAGAQGLLFLPYLNGERTPNLPGGTGVFHGLTTTNMTPAGMARAVMEGATLGLGYGLNRFRELGIEPAEIRLTGGGSRSAVWRQLAADVFGVTTVCLKSAEGAALGAAVQAAWTHGNALGRPEPLEAMAGRLVPLDETTRCEPDAKNVGMYGEIQRRQTDLTAKLSAIGAL